MVVGAAGVLKELEEVVVLAIELEDEEDPGLPPLQGCVDSKSLAT